MASDGKQKPSPATTSDICNVPTVVEEKQVRKPFDGSGVVAFGVAPRYGARRRTPPTLSNRPRSRMFDRCC